MDLQGTGPGKLAYTRFTNCDTRERARRALAGYVGACTRKEWLQRQIFKEKE